MEKKSLNLMFAFLFLVVTLSLTSAAITFDNSPYSLSRTSGFLEFTINSTNATVDSDVTLSINDSRFSLNETSLEKGTAKKVKITYNYSNFESEIDELDSLSFILEAKNDTGVVTSTTVSFDSSYCILGDVGNLEIKYLEDETGNKKDWNWRPLDNVQISFTVKNTHKTEEIYGKVKYCLWDKTNEKCVVKGDINIRVDENDYKDYDISFNLNPSALDSSVRTYDFYIKAYDDDYFGEEEQCDEIKKIVTIKVNSNEVVVDTNEINLPSGIDAGETLTIEIPVSNIGSKTQKGVSIKLYSKSFDLASQIFKIGDIRSGKTIKVPFTFTLPRDLIEGKLYSVSFDIYNEDDYLYEYEDGDGVKVDAVFTKNFKIDFGISDPSKESSKASIYAELDGDAVAGKEVVVKVKISNTDSKIGTFIVGVTGYEDWANSVTISQDTLLLKAEDSQEITLTFKTKKGSEGTNTFDIFVKSGFDEVIATKSASLEMEKGRFFPSFNEENWYIWMIGIFNILLILAIVFVLIRLFF